MISAISLQLKTDIPEVTRRYKESQNQNIIRPCFFVKEISNFQSKQMLERYRRNPRYRITYLPVETSSKIEEECKAIGEKLLGSLRILTLPNGKVFGREMSYEIVNNELQFTVEYPSHFVWSESESAKMQAVTAVESIKQ